MSNAKKTLSIVLPIVIVGGALLLVGVAIFVGTQQEPAPETVSIGNLLDIETPIAGVNDNIDPNQINNILASSSSEPLIGPDGTFDWNTIFNGNQWRFSLDNGVEWALVFEGGLGYLKTQTKPADLTDTKTGSWELICPGIETDVRFQCVGRPGQTVSIRLNQGADEESFETLLVTFVDEETLEGRFADMPSDELLTIYKIVWEE